MDGKPCSRLGLVVQITYALGCGHQAEWELAGEAMYVGAATELHSKATLHSGWLGSLWEVYAINIFALLILSLLILYRLKVSGVTALT